MTGTILRADYIEAHLQESEYRRLQLPLLHRVVTNRETSREIHDLIVADPFHGFIPGKSATINVCKQQAYCLSKNNPGLVVSIEKLDGTVVSQYIAGREV